MMLRSWPLVSEWPLGRNPFGRPVWNQPPLLSTITFSPTVRMHMHRSGDSSAAEELARLRNWLAPQPCCIEHRKVCLLFRYNPAPEYSDSVARRMTQFPTCSREKAELATKLFAPRVSSLLVHADPSRFRAPFAVRPCLGGLARSTTRVVTGSATHVEVGAFALYPIDPSEKVTSYVLP